MQKTGFFRICLNFVSLVYEVLDVNNILSSFTSILLRHSLKKSKSFDRRRMTSTVGENLVLLSEKCAYLKAASSQFTFSKNTWIELTNG